MQYFHRTSLPPDDVLSVADEYLAGRLAITEQTERSRTYHGSIGTLELRVRQEGGHYTFVTIETDQVTESEVDKTAKRVLGLVHKKADPAHRLRGAY